MLLSAASMSVFGLWALLPAGFVDYVNYHPLNEHLVHDAGAFQVGIGAALLFALIWSDALVVTLAGFAVASGLHTMTHFLDRHLGGHGTDVPILAVFTVISLATIALRLRKKATA
ncbi:hypothetical protein Prum_012180 [Phytohabitans rumicis]|uniref:Uncharacterized protein n=1 Tax=Phytohabitans rumicis TaxID=1076125 RepID=A0A6V8L0I2_9ACTN|nr:hypothetical protein Prum_012180 [Phytohabitans rumicis]